MRCPRCQAENREGRRFCAACGVSLALACPACGASNEPGEKFCGGCGRPLGAEAAAPTGAGPRGYTPAHLARKILTSRSALEGERKQVTVLFCDVVESTRLAAQLDPEVMHELMDRVLGLMAEAVHRYEGTVNQFLGDGIMALFGAPVALEDHALRAIQAALAIQETISGLSEDLKRERGLEVHVRLGLNTGLVVVGRIGDDLRMDYTAVGDTTNLAARLQALAEPGRILASEATHRLVEGYVRSAPLGVVPVKGLAAPVAVHRITGRRRRTRLEVGAERGLSPLAGRQRELGILHDCLARSRQGRGQVVGIVGDPGIGKSRLAYEFRKSLEGERITWLEGHCVAYGQATPYLPILEILRANFQIEEGDNPLQIEEKLRRGLRRLDLPFDTTLPFLRELFLLPPDESLKGLDPKAKRQKTFETIRALAVAGSQRAPLVLVHEDLHWVDKSSEDYIAFFVESLPALPVLLVSTHRPGYAVRWADKTYYTQIALDLLSEADSAALMRGLLRADEPPGELVRLVHGKAEGNPLFVEEITRSLVEHGALVRRNGRVVWTGDAAFEFPESVQDIIRARIDRLDEPVKRTAQTAAVIGREFGARLLAQVAETASLLQEVLETLKHAELIHEKRFFPELEYIFKHAIIQDVAYQSILLKRRRELHGAIGRAIEELYADRLVEQYETLAHHFSAADHRDKAVEYLVRAGDKAAAAAAEAEARAFFERALELLAEDDRPRRVEILQKVAQAASRLADPDATIRYSEEALALCEQLGDRRGAFEAHMRIQGLYVSAFWDGAKEDRALTHLEAAAAIVEPDPDTVEKGLLYQRAAHLYMHRCRFDLTLGWARRAVELYQKLGVRMGTSLGTALAYGGRIEEGVVYNEGNWDLVLEQATLGAFPIVAILGHELALTLALARDVRRAMTWAERALGALAPARKASPIWDGFVNRPLALTCALSGDAARGREACAAVEQLERSRLFGCFLEDAAAPGFCHLRWGEWDQARAYLTARLSAFSERNNVSAVAACRLVLGQLELESGRHPEAEALLGRSLDVYREGSNVLMELWALPLLAELYLKTGRRDLAAACVDRGADLLAREGSWYGLPGPIHRARGMVAGAEGSWAAAEDAFARAVEADRAYGLPWDEAKTLSEWGLMLRARGDRDQARQKLGAALEIFQRVEARKDVEKAQAALERL